MACKDCEHFKETLPGLFQCMNVKSVRYKDDVGMYSTCGKGKLTSAAVDEDDWETLRERIKIALAEKGISAKELSEYTSVTYQSIWKTISSRTTPRLLTIMEIAGALNVSIDWLCGLRD